MTTDTRERQNGISELLLWLLLAATFLVMGLGTAVPFLAMLSR